nr:MAG TPA: hypothetical protein [Crassvirales sp.]
MIFRNIQKIKFPFLKEVAIKVSEKYPLDDIYMDDTGGVCFTFKSLLEEKDIKYISDTITPKEYQKKAKVKYLEDYTFGTKETHVFSIEGLNYKNLNKTTLIVTNNNEFERICPSIEEAYNALCETHNLSSDDHVHIEFCHVNSESADYSAIIWNKDITRF